jgi:serine phosphatase RsbU (regulator of sigma subunit)
MFPDSSYRESVVQLSPGDLVIAYTDGVIEVANPVGEEWGSSGFVEGCGRWGFKMCGRARSLDLQLYG